MYTRREGQHERHPAKHLQPARPSLSLSLARSLARSPTCFTINERKPDKLPFSLSLSLSLSRARFLAPGACHSLCLTQRSHGCGGGCTAPPPPPSPFLAQREMPNVLPAGADVAQRFS